MRELNLDQLRTLVCIAELGSFSNAARALHLAQPTISLHVSELESRLGTPLVVRGGRRVLPTAAGEVLVARARRLLGDVEEAVDAVKRHRDGRVGRVRLGSSTGAMVHLLPQVLEALELAHPNIDVQVITGRSSELMAKLFVGDVDLALVAIPQSDYPHISVTPWRRTPMVALVPAGWKAPKIATPQWLASQPLIFNEPTTHVYRQTMDWFGAAGLRSKPRIEMNYNEVTRRLVAAGYGAAILPLEHPSDAPAGRVQVLRLRPAMTRRLGVAHRRDPVPDGPIRHVLDTVMSFGEPRRSY
jgi:DNA-binding transcriptional LysR family regulator